jgi:hypothetical protein
MALTTKQQETLKRTTRAFEAYGIADGLAKGKGVIAATYNFATLGGAVGDIALGAKFDQAVIVTDIYLQKVVDPDSGGLATIAVKAGSTALVAATAFDNAAFTGTGKLTLTSSATAIEVPADSELTITVAVAALTAGQFRLCVEFIPARDL